MLNFTGASKGVVIKKVVSLKEPTVITTDYINFNYIYKHPIATITFTCGDAKGLIMAGTVDEDTKTMTGTFREKPEAKVVFKMK